MVRINGLFHLLINGVYWGYNLLTNHLLTSWDIQVSPENQGPGLRDPGIFGDSELGKTHGFLRGFNLLLVSGSGVFFFHSLSQGDGHPTFNDGNPYFMGPYKPLRNWVDEFIPYYMEIISGILPIGELYATYHLLGEPETTIDEFIPYYMEIMGV